MPLDNITSQIVTLRNITELIVSVFAHNSFAVNTNNFAC